MQMSAKIRHALLLSREVEAGVVAVSDLSTGEQTDIPAGEAVRLLAIAG